MESRIVFPAADKRVRDGKDHFPIMSENLVAEAIKRAMGYKKAPAWFDGGVKELQEAVNAAVKVEKVVEKIEESVDGKKADTTSQLNETVETAFGFAQELLGLNESVDEINEIKVGTCVLVITKRNLDVIYESVEVAQINEQGVEVSGNEAEVDQEWYSFDTCQIYPV